MGQYAGNESITLEFDIINKQEPDVPSEIPSEEPSTTPSEVSTSSGNNEKPNNDKKGCKGETAATGFILLALIGALSTKKRKNQ